MRPSPLPVQWELVVDNMGLCYSFARRYWRRWQGITSLESFVWEVCLDVLVRCSRTWNADRDVYVRFSTYAYEAMKKSAYASIDLQPLQLETEQHNEPASVEKPFDFVDDREQAYYILRRLHRFDRIVLFLRFWREMDYVSIAAVIGVSQPTAKTYVLSALQAAREVVKKSR